MKWLFNVVDTRRGRSYISRRASLVYWYVIVLHGTHPPTDWRQHQPVGYIPIPPVRIIWSGEALPCWWRHHHQHHTHLGGDLFCAAIIRIASICWWWCTLYSPCFRRPDSNQPRLNDTLSFCDRSRRHGRRSDIYFVVIPSWTYIITLVSPPFFCVYNSELWYLCKLFCTSLWNRTFIFRGDV